MNMPRLFCVRLIEDRARVLFRISEIAALFVVFTIFALGVICGPYLLGLLPELAAQFSAGAQ
ncbi:MAG: hypothetical protein OIF47_00530 [Marinibacterium sp.]|nr:hypothetical protein [Marinibacterium sp.]